MKLKDGMNMKSYNQKIQEITDLVLVRKAIDKAGMEHLKQEVKAYLEKYPNTDMDKIITMIVNYVFNCGFHEGVVECLKILRSR